MTQKQDIPAISEISDPDRIRIIIFRDGGFVHAPLPALVKHLLDRIEDLEGRVTDLETP